MSIEKDSYTSKKTGKTTVKYYAVVWYPEEKRKIRGPARSTEKLARQDETDIQRRIAAGHADPPPKVRKVTVDQVYQEWHKATAPPVYSNNTWQIYARFYRDYIADVFGSKAVSVIAPLHVQRYVNLMAEKYSPETVNKCLNILTDLFRFAKDVLKCITANPADGISRCRVSRKKKATWSDAQIERFLSFPDVQASHYFPMLCVSASLGARPGEVCGLREDALIAKPGYRIDLDRGYDNYECETDLKTKKSHRTLPIPEALYKTLSNRRAWKHRMQLKNPSWGQNDYLFVSQRGRPIKPHQYANAFKRLLDAFNAATDDKLPEIRLYGFRTSFATNCMRTVPDAALISSIMGNSPKTLLEFYVQSDTEAQKGIVDNYIVL